MKQSFLLATISALFTSAVWFLAVNDGTVDSIRSYYQDQQEQAALVAEEENLKLEVSILKSRLQKKVLKTWLVKMEGLR